MKKKVLIGFSVGIVLLVILTNLGNDLNSNIYEYEYSTIEKVSDSGVRAWFPKNMSDDTYDLYIIYDANIIKCNGYYSIKSVDNFKKGKEKIQKDLLKNIETYEGKKMDDSVRKELLENDNIEIYKDSSYIYALTDKKVYFWYVRK